IVSIVLSPEQVKAVANAPIAVIQSTNGWQSNPPFLTEQADGSWVRADGFVFRFNPGDELSTTFYATTFGEPSPNAPISLTYDPTLLEGFIDQGGPVPGPSDLGAPL